MRVWRIKLKGCDLYYQPVKGRWGELKTNLGPRGKVYLWKKPDISFRVINISKSQLDKYPKSFNKNRKNRTEILCDVNKEMFEIIEYELKEVENEERI